MLGAAPKLVYKFIFGGILRRHRLSFSFRVFVFQKLFKKLFVAVKNKKVIFGLMARYVELCVHIPRKARSVMVKMLFVNVKKHRDVRRRFCKFKLMRRHFYNSRHILALVSHF